MNKLMPLSKVCQLARNLKSFSDALFRTIMSQATLREILYHYIDWRDQRYIKQTIDRVPPASLRFRVHGDVNIYSFLEAGKGCSQDIIESPFTVQTDINSFRNILDFGCGCGRTIIGSQTKQIKSNFTELMVDADAIEWCRQNPDFAKFEVDESVPPLVTQRTVSILFTPFRFLRTSMRIINSDGWPNCNALPSRRATSY